MIDGNQPFRFHGMRNVIVIKLLRIVIRKKGFFLAALFDLTADQNAPPSQAFVRLHGSVSINAS
jgi:hypothetical protein